MEKAKTEQDNTKNYEHKSVGLEKGLKSRTTTHMQAKLFSVANEVKLRAVYKRTFGGGLESTSRLHT